MTPHARVVAAVLAATTVALLTVTGCGRDGDATTTQPTSAAVKVGQGHDAHTDAPDPLARVTTDPDATAETALAVMFSWRPGSDPGPAAAVARALPYLGGGLAAAATVTLTEPLLPEQWSAWARSRDLVTATATVRVGDPRAHTDAAQATRVLDLRRTVLHTDGQATPLPDTVAIVELAHTAAGWRVTGYHLTSG